MHDVNINHHNFRGDLAKPKTGHWRARQLFDLGKCEKCDQSAVERHHKDGNTLNNDPLNIERLCRRHHMESDGRLAQLISNNKIRQKPLPAIPCITCGVPSKPLRRGKCHKCNEFFRHNGFDWSLELSRPRKIISKKVCIA